MESKCPGQDGRELSAEIIRCADCGYGVEMFSDETRRRCPGCKKVVYRRQMPSCIDWCRYAEKCVGERFFNRYRRDMALLMKEKLMEDIESMPGDDSAGMAHIKAVLSEAEKLLEKEKADFHIVLPAAILHCAAESRGQGIEAAKKKMLEQGFRKEDMDEISEIISSLHHALKTAPGKNSRVLRDAHGLACLKKSVRAGDAPSDFNEFIEKSFLTETGKALAREYSKAQYA